MVDNLAFIDSWPPNEGINKYVNDDDVSEEEEVSLKRRKIKDDEKLVHASNLLSKWWRQLPDEERKKHPPVKSKAPSALLNAISKTAEARKFLHEVLIEKSTNCNSLYTRTTVLNFLRKDQQALDSAELCLKKRGLRHLHESTDVKSNLNYIKSLSDNDIEILRVATLAFLQVKAISNQNSDTNLTDKDIDVNNSPQVDVKHLNELTLEIFKEHYAHAKRPLVIEGCPLTKSGKLWSLDHINLVAGQRKFSPRYGKPDSMEWAKLETRTEETTSIQNFVQNIQSGAEKEGYLFDWSLPLFCPELYEELLVPPYFKDDYLKNVESSLYKSSWPSLFVAPKGTGSGLHIDSFGSSFWMALHSGQKKWTFFDPCHTNRLRPRYFDSFDPVFDIEASSSTLKSLSPFSLILKPGQILFVPAGCPHKVENLQTSIAVSGNIVNDTNVKEASVHLQRNALVDHRAGELLEEWLHRGLIK